MLLPCQYLNYKQLHVLVRDERWCQNAGSRRYQLIMMMVRQMGRMVRMMMVMMMVMVGRMMVVVG